MNYPRLPASRFEQSEVNTPNAVLIPFESGRNITVMRPVEFGEALAAGTRLIFFSDDEPDHLFTVINFGIDKVSGIALALKTGVPTYQVEDEEGRTHLLIHLPIEEENEHRWCL